jgi:hypothetical protein
MLMKKYSIALVCAAAVMSFSAGAAPTPADGFMVVNADGSVARATQGYTVAKFGTGQYEVSYTAWLYNCGHSITAGTSDASVPAQGFATLLGRTESPEILEISTYDASGQFADRGFHLIVRC